MKSTVCACVLFYLVTIGNAQWGMFGPQSMFGGYGLDPLTMALLFGFDYNELMALQTITGGNRGRSMRPGLQQQTMRDIEVLSALGLIDGPDGPDPRRGGGQGGGPGKGRPAGGRGGGAEAEAGPARPRQGQGANKQGPKKQGPKKQGPKRQGPRRRQRPNRRGGNQ